MLFENIKNQLNVFGAYKKRDTMSLIKENKYDVITSTIARGISIGDDLEYTDEITLARSITNRIPFETSIKN